MTDHNLKCPFCHSRAVMRTTPNRTRIACVNGRCHEKPSLSAATAHPAETMWWALCDWAWEVNT